MAISFGLEWTGQAPTTLTDGRGYFWRAVRVWDIKLNCLAIQCYPEGLPGTNLAVAWRPRTGRDPSTSAETRVSQ